MRVERTGRSWWSRRPAHVDRTRAGSRTGEGEAGSGCGGFEAVEYGEQVVDIERLRDICVGTEPGGFRPVANRCERGHDDDAGSLLARELHRLAQHRPAVHRGHHDVE